MPMSGTITVRIRKESDTMLFLWIGGGVLTLLAVISLIASYICFYKLFYASRTKNFAEEYPVPDVDFLGEYAPDVEMWIEKASKLEYRDVEIKSFDGLTLRGKYYERDPKAPIEILLHGYRGDSVRDLSGGIFRCFSIGHNVLLVDQRAAGRSEGHIISFGVNESRDCADWISFVINNINPEAKIVISGVSMGASTVLIAAGRELPENVVGVLADCGFTSAKAEIKKVMKDMKLPSDLIYPFARLGGILFGGFDVDSVSSIESVKKARVPIIFLHGEGDEFVPCYMSRENYEACVSEKKLVTFPRAGHGLSYPADPERYLIEGREFFRPILGDQAPFDVEY